MKKAFFDTWGWVAIAHKEDNYHKQVLSFYENFLINKGIPVTTDYVLSETITLLKTRTKGVEVFMDTMLEAVRNEKVLLHRIDDSRWQKTWTMCKKFKDKPAISFVDFSSIIVMKEFNVKDILTNDNHFTSIGMGFRKLF